MTTVEMPTANIAGVMWKTVSEACNLACDYCYYSTCKGRPGKINRIDDTTLEKFIKEYMAIKKGGVPFAWQGGEPLLAGLDFFKRVVYLQAKHAPRNTTISNSIQTNGMLINKEWASFFKKYNFLVGVSLDGPEEINDARRVTSTGKGSYQSIMKGISHLKEAEVDFNILTVLHENNIEKATELMNFYKENEFTYVQFIPCMDFMAQDVERPPKYLITPKQYGDFLCEAFDVWYNDGEPHISVRFFDNMLAVYLHQLPELCSHQKTCPKTIIFEQNGDAYPCDFFIDEKYKLGNISVDSLENILNNEILDNFLAKKPDLSEACQMCEYRSLCHGGCPRNRARLGGEQSQDFFCESFKQVYRYAHDRMLIVAKNIKKKRMKELVDMGYPLPERNDRCICGSNKKYKKCCEPLKK